MSWFWIGYFSLGLWILMPGLVDAWKTTSYAVWLKVVGLTISVLIWPVAFFIGDEDA